LSYLDARLRSAVAPGGLGAAGSNGANLTAIDLETPALVIGSER